MRVDWNNFLVSQIQSSCKQMLLVETTKIETQTLLLVTVLGEVIFPTTENVDMVEDVGEMAEAIIA